MIKKGDSSKGYTKEKVLKAIEGSYGIKSTIAKRLGCTWLTAQRMCEKWEETKEAYNDEREIMLDDCESVIVQSVKSGDVGTAKWCLSMLGKRRGYTEKMQEDNDAVLSRLDSVLDAVKESATTK